MEKLVAIIIVAAAAALILFSSRLRRKRIQPYLDDFATAFCEASDHLLGSANFFGTLKTEAAGNQRFRVLAADEQPEAIRALFERGVDDYVLERIRSMFQLRDEAQKHLTSVNLIGKRVNGVMNRVYDMANLSFSIINNPELPLKESDLQDFDFFLNRQEYIRNTTLAAIVSDECRARIAR